MASNLFYRNPRLTALTLGLVLVAGLSALQVLPRQEDPALARRFATVTTFFPGASALRVESLVTEKIESQLQELHEIEEIDSVSRTGVSVLQIELADRFEEADVDEVWSKVRDRIADAAAELPPGALPPEFEDRTSTAVTLLVGLTWEQAGAPELGLLSRLAEELENQLRNVTGTKETEVFGEAEEEVRVTVDPSALASVNLTAADVSRAVARADAKLPAGQLRHGANDLLIEVAGELSSIERVRRIPLREEADGRLLRLGDVATVEKTVREPASTIALLSGRRGVAVAATMEPNRRVDRWAEEARGVVEAFRAEIPRGVGYAVLFDQSLYTDERLANLVGNLLLGASMVVVVLFVTMGLRSALIVSATLPLAIAMVLALMLLIGMPLHQTSVTGLIVALGLLIDNAIVVVDEYDQRARRGASPADAVAGAVGHLFVPLFASTLTTVLAFLPIALMPGGAGEFVGPIAIGVGLAVTSSFALAMTVVPALAGFVTPDGPKRKSAWWRDGFTHPRLTGIYRRSLRLVLRRPAIGIAVSLALPLFGFAVARTLPQQFFPANDRDQFQVQIALPTQASIGETRAAGERARALIHAHDEVVESHWFFGESAPRVFYNMFNIEDGISSFAGGFVTTTSAEATEELLPRLQRELIEAFPTARAIALPFEQGPALRGADRDPHPRPDLAELRRLGEEVRAILTETRAVTYTDAKLRGGEPKLLVAADEEEARLAACAWATSRTSSTRAWRAPWAARSSRPPRRFRCACASAPATAPTSRASPRSGCWRRARSGRRGRCRPRRPALRALRDRARARDRRHHPPQRPALQQRAGLPRPLRPHRRVAGRFPRAPRCERLCGARGLSRRARRRGRAAQRGHGQARRLRAAPLRHHGGGGDPLVQLVPHGRDHRRRGVPVGGSRDVRRVAVRLSDGIRRDRRHHGAGRPRHQRRHRGALRAARERTRPRGGPRGDRRGRDRSHAPHRRHDAHHDRRLPAPDPRRRALLAPDGDRDRGRRGRLRHPRALPRALALHAGGATRPPTRAPTGAHPEARPGALPGSPRRRGSLAPPDTFACARPLTSG